MVFLVDDQAMVGEAIRRSLPKRKTTWDFHYCSNPAEAMSQAFESTTVILRDTRHCLA